MPDDNLSYEELKERLFAAEAALEALRQQEQSRTNHTVSERRYQALFENMNAGFVLFEVVQDDNGIPIDLIILAANNGFETTTGLKTSEVIGKRLTQALPGIENDPADWIGTYGNIALTGKSRQFEEDSRLLGYYYSVIAYQAGPKQCAVTFIYITARQQAEKILQKSEEKFRAIYEQSPIAIQIYDKAGLLIDVNPQTLKIYGLEDKSSILGYDMWSSSFLSPERTEALKNGNPVFVPAHLDFEEVKEANLFSTGKSGILYLEMYAIPLKHEQEITGYLVQMLDVTERKEMQAKFLQTQKLESIGRLAGGIAHDFNNILIPIIGYVEMALKRLSPDDKLYDNLQRVREASERAATLTRQILAFSRKQMLEMRVLDLNPVVSDFQKMLQRLIGEDIELHTFLEPASCRIMADQGQIEQVLLNLVVNARDAMAGGGKVTIETADVYLDNTYVKKFAGSYAPGPYIMLAVSDTGCGMDAEVQQHIFEPFFTTKEKGKGTGLGLSTVFGIVQQHNGIIWVYSEPGNGATFKIYLPRVEEAAQTAKITVPEPTLIYGTETILVVEDETMVRQLVCETLSAYGYQVIEAQSATDGLRLATESQPPPHLLLTDVIMPEMNGRILYQKIAQVHPDIKVLYMSGYTDNVIVHHGILDKGINFLQKPFSIQSLTRKVKQVLG